MPQLILDILHTSACPESHSAERAAHVMEASRILDSAFLQKAMPGVGNIFAVGLASLRVGENELRVPFLHFKSFQEIDHGLVQAYIPGPFSFYTVSRQMDCLFLDIDFGPAQSQDLRKSHAGVDTNEYERFHGFAGISQHRDQFVLGEIPGSRRLIEHLSPAQPDGNRVEAKFSLCDRPVQDQPQQPEFPVYRELGDFLLPQSSGGVLHPFPDVSVNVVVGYLLKGQLPKEAHELFRQDLIIL